MKRRLGDFVVILVVLCLLGGCSSGSTSATVAVEYTPPFLPITMKIDSDGNIGIQVEQHVVTLVGTFAVTADVVHSPQLQSNPLSLVIRHKVQGRIVDDVFSVATDEVDVLLDGQTSIQVVQHRVFVDASAGNVQSIVIKDTRPVNNPQPTTSVKQATGVRPSDPSRPWQGTWQGLVYDSGAPPYSAVMKLMQANPNDDDSVSGSVQYPDYHCTGTLQEMGRAGDIILMREDEPAAPCITVEWQFSLDASGGTLTAKGTYNLSGNVEVNFVRGAA